MPKEISDTNLMKLRKLLSLMDEEAITKEDFLTLSKNIVGFMVKNQQVLADKTNKTIADLNALFKDLEGKINVKTDSEVRGAIKELKEAVEKALREQEAGMNLVRDKLRAFAEQKSKDDEKLKNELLTKIPEIKETILDTPEQIRNKIEKLKGDERLEIKAINSLQEKLDELKDSIGRRPIFGGGVSKMSIDRHFIDDETPQNSGDNINFTIAHTPNPTTSLKLYRGGSRQRITEDYTLNNKTITLNTALQTGEILLCDYKK